MNYILNSDKKSRYRNAPARYTEFEVYACMHFCSHEKNGNRNQTFAKNNQFIAYYQDIKQKK